MGGTTTKTAAADAAPSKAEADLAKAKGDLTAARAQVRELTKDKEKLTQDLGKMTGERDQLRAELEVAAQGLNKAKTDLRKARAKAAPKPPRLRPIAPIGGDLPEPRGQDLLELIGAAETVELVFSDGKRELGTVPAQLIEGDAWILAANGVRLRDVDLPVYGPAHGRPAIRIAGYGLVLDGELTAYQSRIDLLELQPNARANLRDDVIFN
jgi:hypothetical protein